MFPRLGSDVRPTTILSPRFSAGFPGPTLSSSTVVVPLSGPLVRWREAVWHLPRPPWPPPHAPVVTVRTVAVSNAAGAPRLDGRAGSSPSGQRTTRPTTVATTRGATESSSSRLTRAGSGPMDPSPWSPVTGGFCRTASDHDTLQVLARRVGGGHLVQRVEHDLAHGPVAVPLVIRGDDEPGSGFRRRLLDRLRIGGYVVVPPFALGQVSLPELPSLRRVVGAVPEPLRLFVARDVEEELQDARSGGGQARLELVDDR